MVPQVVSVRVEPAWSARKALLECRARISRPLTARERAAMARFPEFAVSGRAVAWSCRPEEMEACEKRLAAALARSAREGAIGRRWRPSTVRLVEAPSPRSRLVL